MLQCTSSDYQSFGLWTNMPVTRVYDNDSYCRIDVIGIVRRRACRCTWCSSATCLRPTWRQVLWERRKNCAEPSDISSAWPACVRQDALTQRPSPRWNDLAAAWQICWWLGTGRHRPPTTRTSLIGTDIITTVPHSRMPLVRPSGTRQLSRTGNL